MHKFEIQTQTIILKYTITFYTESAYMNFHNSAISKSMYYCLMYDVLLWEILKSRSPKHNF